MTTIKVRLGSDSKLIVQFPYDPATVSKIKTIPGRVWIPEDKVWKIPYREGTLELLRTTFAADTLNIVASSFHTISEVTRRDIIDYIIAMQPPFYGRLTLIQFLSRVWDLSAMPSTDSRFKDAEGDIWKHMVDNDDWDYEYLFISYFHLLDAPIEDFLKLVEQVVHPIVATDDEYVLEIVAKFNDMLAPDGYTLIVEKRISGHPIYKAVPLDDISRDPTAPYDVVLSFAGEERPFVQQIATYLKTHGVKCFYDENETVDLWGKDLVEHLDKIYGGDSAYCVMFISESYARKMWPIHERRSALARAVKKIDEYILPVRFDDTQLDGLHHTIGYIDATGKSPEEIAKLIIAKLGKLHRP